LREWHFRCVRALCKTNRGASSNAGAIFPASLRGARAFDAAFFDEDLVLRVVGDTLVLAPALIATEGDIEAITSRVGRLLRALR